MCIYIMNMSNLNSGCVSDSVKAICNSSISNTRL